MNKKVYQSLASLLSSAVEFYFLYKGYHWNLNKTLLFNTFHTLFDKHAENIFQSIDILAERLRFLDQKVSFYLSDYKQNSFLDLTNYSTTVLEEMLDNLKTAHQSYIQKLEEGIKEANECEDFGTADMLTEILRDQQQMLWFIQSSLV